MVLLHAAARSLPAERLLVATFDHATGPFAAQAVQLVASEAARLGLEAVVGRAAANAGSEAGWRADRHAFLSDVARRFDARVMTAHTRDDQVETVLMRLLRDAGARGLAGLHARSATLRPLLEFTRAEVTRHAVESGVRWMDDPTNASHEHFRNRVRHDLLPALARVAPDLGDALVGASRRAAQLRDAVDEWIDANAARVVRSGYVAVSAGALTERSDEELMLLWPAIAARAGVAMDWRGTARAAAFTRKGRVGATIQLSGGWSITRSRERLELHRRERVVADAVALVPGLRWEHWSFDAATVGGANASDAWEALLPPHDLTVRAWRAGDRMVSGGLERRVKRFLSDAGVTGELRTRWPVVLMRDQIVWIPGVRRSDAAAVRPGRPGVLFRCDYDRR